MKCASRKRCLWCVAIGLLVWCSAAVTLAASGASASVQSATKEATPLSPTEQHVLLRLIRQNLTPNLTNGELNEVPPSLVERAGREIFISLYHNGSRLGTAHASHGTLAASALAAAMQLKQMCERQPNGAQALKEGRLLVEVLTTRRTLEADSKRPLLQQLELGTEGLCAREGDASLYFPPLVVLRQSHAPRFMEALYAEYGRPPPGKGASTRWEAFRTQAFVEAAPGGPPLQLERGRVLLREATHDNVLRACLAAGVWLLHMQEPDGTFMERYDPLLTYRFPGTDHHSRISAAGALYVLYRLTNHRGLLEGAEKVVARAKTVAREDTLSVGDLEVRYAYLHYTVRPETLPSAVFLQTLCERAATRGEVADKALMERLGRFMLLMTSPKGLVYRSLVEAAARREPPGPAEGINEEAAIALCRLYRHAPEKIWLAGAARILQALLLAQGDSPSPRFVVALAEYYSVSNDRRYAEHCLRCARQLLRRQQSMPRPGETTLPADYVGGFPESGPPTVRWTAEAVEALAYACAVARDVGAGDQELHQGVRLALRFLLNQQFRQEDAFFLPHLERFEGGFRQSPVEIFVQVSDADAAIRAMIASLPLMSRIVPKDK